MMNRAQRRAVKKQKTPQEKMDLKNLDQKSANNLPLYEPLSNLSPADLKEAGVKIEDMNEALKSQSAHLPTPESLNKSKKANPKNATGTSNVSGGRNYKYDKLGRSLVENIAGLGMLLSVLPTTQADGLVVISHAESLSEKLVTLSKENESVYNALNTLVSGSAWAGVLVEAGVIGLAIAGNHGLQIPIPGMTQGPNRFDQNPYPEMVG